MVKILDIYSPDKENQIYGEAVKGFNSERARNSLNAETNLFKILLLNQIGIRTPTLPELDLLHQNNPDYFRKFYAYGRDIVFRNEEDYKNNIPIAENLKKLTGFGEYPYIIRGLEIKESDNYYGLTLVAGDELEIFSAPDFAHCNHWRRFGKINQDYSIDWVDENGIDFGSRILAREKVGHDGSRLFRSRSKGVSALVLNRTSLNSAWDGLDVSNSHGRVVLAE